MMLSTPQPAVLHLLTIFRQIGAGEIRIPAFQRDFVWRERQILDLLDSVRSGYPIGSILLWYAERQFLKTQEPIGGAFPDVPERYPTNYVLDGMQRLSSLYGVFHFGTTVSNPKFNVWYDLDMEVFLHEEDIQVSQLKTCLPLAALFSPRELLGHQAKFASLSEGDLLIDRLVALQAAFQDYMLPVVQIRGEDVSAIVGIFEKINSTGTSLSRVDFMRAITWAQDFDLSHAISLQKGWLEFLGYDFDDETIVKCVGMVLGLSPTVDALLELRSQSSQNLHEAFKRVGAQLTDVMAFLSNEMHIPSTAYVPYEGQLLVAFRVVGMDAARTDEERRRLVRWLWASSFNESLRGKPDHYVTRAIADWPALISGGIRGLEPRLRLTEVDFIERRLIKGKALSAAFALMFASRGAVALDTNRLIETSFYLNGGDTSAFVPILSVEELERAGLKATTSARIFANLVVIPSARGSSVAVGEWLRQNKPNIDALESQFIDLTAWSLLAAGDALGFLTQRSKLLLQHAVALTER